MPCGQPHKAKNSNSPAGDYPIFCLFPFDKTTEVVVPIFRYKCWGNVWVDSFDRGWGVAGGVGDGESRVGA